MSEQPKDKCRGCSKEKIRVYSHTTPSKQKKYRDENGKLWYGKRCPACRKKDNKIRWQQYKKEIKEAEERFNNFVKNTR